MDIGAWLRDLGLDQYEQAFRDNDVDVDLLARLTADDLREIGVASVGHRRRLLEAAVALRVAAVPPSVPHAEVPERPHPEGPVGAERRQLTVMFVDLVGSTALSARLDPEETRELLRAYQDAVTAEVARFDGHVAKYMGDGVLCYFGWPTAHEDEAERAVRAGLAVADAASHLAAPTGEPLACRVGIATGLVVVGDLLGEGAAREEAVTGETPNLAARLQAIAGPGGVVVAHDTRRLTGDLFECRDLGAVEMKGFADPVQAWRVLRPSAVESRFEALRGASLTPLVGREEEIGLLLRRWGRATSGEGQVVLLSAEPGVGKSRLVTALQERLRDEPHARLHCFCSPYHGNDPLHPIIGQLARAAGFARADAPGARLGKLEALLAPTSPPAGDVALLAELLSVPTDGRYPPLELTPRRKREETFGVLLRQLELLARQRPALMVYEDVHWIDPTSRELLDLTVERVQRLPVLLLVTFRPEFQPPWTGQPHVTTLALGRLGRREGAALVEGVAGGRMLPAGTVEEILERADGVPLFVEELTKAVIEAGAHGAGEEATTPAPRPAPAVPATLHASLMARLDRLGPSVREIAQVGSAIGREFPYELLAAVAGRSDAELRGALDRLVGAGLVLRRGEPPQSTYLFKHALVQDAAYGTLLRSKRRTLHGRIAEVLEERFPRAVESEPALLARHCAEAGLTGKAVQYYARAGKQAIARSAMAEAVAMLREALGLVAGLPDGPERWRHELELHSALGVALIAVKGYSAVETGEVYARARTLCDRLGDVGELVRATSGRFFFHLVRSETEAARGTAEDLLRVAEEVGAPEARLKAHQLMGTGLYQQGVLALAHAHLEAAASLRDGAGEPVIGTPAGNDARVAVPVYLALTLCLLGRCDAARKQSGLALAEARRSRRPHRLAFAVATNGWLRVLLREDTSGVAEELAAVAREQAFPYWAGVATFFRAETAAKEGRRTEAAALFEEGVRTFRAIGTVLGLPWWSSLVTPMLEASRAENLLVEQLGRIETTGERWCEPEVHRSLGEVARRRGDPGRARACFEEAIAIARRQEALFWELRAACSLARLWAEAGERRRARDLLAPIYARFTEGFDAPDLQNAKALLDELR